MGPAKADRDPVTEQGQRDTKKARHGDAGQGQGSGEEGWRLREMKVSEKLQERGRWRETQEAFLLVGFYPTGWGVLTVAIRYSPK